MSQEEMSFGHLFQRLMRMLDGDDALLPCDNMHEVMPEGPDDYPTLFVTLEEEPDQAVRFWLDRVDTVWGEQGVRVISRLPAGVWLYTTEHDRQMPTHTLQWCHLRMSTAVPTRPAGLGGLALIAMHARDCIRHSVRVVIACGQSWSTELCCVTGMAWGVSTRSGKCSSNVGCI